MCYKYLNGEYACKKLKRCTEKYEPFIVYCQNAKEEGQYCKDVRPIQKPIIIPVECSRHNQVRLDQFKKMLFSGRKSERFRISTRNGRPH